jgi:hypothetical protein
MLMSFLLLQKTEETQDLTISEGYMFRLQIYPLGNGCKTDKYQLWGCSLYLESI